MRVYCRQPNGNWPQSIAMTGRAHCQRQVAFLASCIAIYKGRLGSCPYDSQSVLAYSTVLLHWTAQATCILFEPLLLHSSEMIAIESVSVLSTRAGSLMGRLLGQGESST